MLRGVLLAAQDVTVQQLPQPRPPRPRITVDIPFGGGFGVPVGTVERIVIRGTAFQQGSPIEVIVDGQAQKISDPMVDASGTFAVTISPTLPIGAHTILVRQRTPSGVNQDVIQFNVTVGEEENERERERQPQPR